MVSKGCVMRSKESGEIVRVVEVGAFVRYQNDDVDGEVNQLHLDKEFEVLNDPSSREDIEIVLKVKVEADEAETGLYDCGISYVVVDRVDGEVTFQWFEHAMPFGDVLLND